MTPSKIFHRILYTNTKLMQCKLSETERCTFCENGRETILHLLWECFVTKSFWFTFLRLIQHREGIDRPCTSNTVLFRISNINYEYEINLLLLILRFFLYITVNKWDNPYSFYGETVRIMGGTPQLEAVNLRK